ncbi:HAD-IA family hydrolase [Croceicoccus sp. F390]|uniref:HAD-IA family hydrolase n=1 Tax=Croceicoccus esteveae TaxID=3075597 RepID=A0ABU2ZDG8_9SPHN|nr:HAD-IA family hydrolase [Croceicoccus sp. F390]MDT0574644.1 HAD-IA family hydrolase [Croceicoccus sp. F390]
MTQLAIFDCDGTLVDGQANVCAAMEHAFGAAGRAPPPQERIRRIVGLSLPQAMAALLPDSSAQEHQTLAGLYREAFRAQRAAGLVSEPLFDGIHALLNRLHGDGWTLAVATGKSARGLAHCLAKNDIADLFISLQTADDHPSKPHPSMIISILQQTGMKSDTAVMIGDTSFDMAMAGAAGIRGIGVAWGYHRPAELLVAGAAGVARDAADLSKLLRAA